MTNKDALERLVKQANARKLSNKIVVNRWDYEKLLELVERDTAKKPFVNILNGITEYNCGVCVCSLDIPQIKELNFCPECGNRIDWS